LETPGINRSGLRTTSSAFL